MTDDPSPQNDGRRSATLFESLPDPLLAFTREHDDSDASADPLVVRTVNAAFETTFDVEIEAGRTLLDDVVLGGEVVCESDTDADGNTSSESDSNADVTATTHTTARSLLECLQQGEESSLSFRCRSGDETRYFRVRLLAPDAGDHERYLHFADVSALERRRRELVTAVERLERLARVVSHDLRNPLEVAHIRLEAARDTGEAVHFEKVEDALDRIERIVDDVLTAGATAIEPTDAVALADVAEAAWETVDTADATLVVESGLPTLRADADRLQRVFENLFRNSVEHAGRDVTVTVEPLPNGFVVADDGPGVPATVREDAFDAGTSTRSGSRGLGLAIVSRIAREHGWEVSLASSQDASTDGARFEFTGISRSDRPDDS